MDNKNEMIKRAIAKYAGLNWGEIGNKVVGGLVVGGTLLGVAAIAEKIADLVHEHSQIKKEKEYFEKMLEYYPQLQKEDPERIAALWSSLVHYAPAMASDPHSAGAFIVQSNKQTLFEEFGGLPIDTFKTLAETQKLVNDARKKESLIDEVKKQTIVKSIGHMISSND